MKKELISVFILILTASFVFAVPSIPHIFSGVVGYSEKPFMVLTGYDITASIGDAGLGIVGKVKENNKYNIAIDPQGKTGEIIFYIGGSKAEETAIYEWGGESFNFDLTINELPTNALCGNGIQEPGEQCDRSDLGTGTCENVLGIPGATGTLSCTNVCTFDYSNCVVPYCGDGLCNNDETCSSCPDDCACSSGYECINGICKKKDTDSSNGGSPGGGSPSGTRPIITTTTTTGTQTNTSEDKEDNSIDLISNENQKTTGPGITGGVIGFVKSGAGMGVLVLFIIIIGLGVIILKRKTSKNEK